MRYTEKLRLNLPEDTDPLEIGKISENFEKLDTLGGGLEGIQEGTGPGSLFLPTARSSRLSPLMGSLP